MNENELLQQKRKIILFFKEYKVYPQFRAIINLMAAIADYPCRIDDVPSLFKGKTHIGQLTQEEIEALLEWITKTFNQIRNLVIDREYNNLTPNEIINKYYNIVDSIIMPYLSTIL